MILRRYTSADSEAVAHVFRDSVRTLGPLGYSPLQVEAWARAADDLTEFTTRLNQGATLVTEMDGSIVAFGQLHPTDHVAMMYCKAEQGRRGISSAILVELENLARSNSVNAIYTEASKISRPFFEKHGYVVREIERVVRFGSEFKRFQMLKPLRNN